MFVADDDEESEHRRVDFLDDMQYLEQQFSDLKELWVVLLHNQLPPPHKINRLSWLYVGRCRLYQEKVQELDQKIAEVSKGETVCVEVVWPSLFYFVCG